MNSLRHFFYSAVTHAHVHHTHTHRRSCVLFQGINVSVQLGEEASYTGDHVVRL